MVADSTTSVDQLSLAPDPGVRLRVHCDARPAQNLHAFKLSAQAELDPAEQHRSRTVCGRRLVDCDKQDRGIVFGSEQKASLSKGADFFDHRVLAFAGYVAIQDRERLAPTGVLQETIRHSVGRADYRQRC